MPLILLLLSLATALTTTDQRISYLAWQERQEQPVEPHPEPGYRFMSEIHAELAELVRRRPGVIHPFRAGRSVRRAPLWAFRIHRPDRPSRIKVLVFAGLHALEWIGSEVATSWARNLVLHPVDGVEVVVLPIANPDGRQRVEQDLLEGTQRYRRANWAGTDLNRDFGVHREPTALWRHLLPGYYASSPSALSQPETRAIDKLAMEQFDVVVSLHAFGGWIFYPWAGKWDQTPHELAFVELSQVLQRGQGAHAYRARQLSRWGFFFRAQGSEIDHLYGKYESLSFIIELTRSGIERPRVGGLEVLPHRRADFGRVLPKHEGRMEGRHHGDLEFADP
ncbi:MAG: M14 family metallopeptidase, partial [Myxococcota bacterium]|nr:M14 family metallopeptidase [Myxococcota bacterium]